MVVSLYPVVSGVWSFRKQPDTQPLRVKAPRGSTLLEVRGLGLELFVPAVTDPLQRIAWNPRQVLQEANRGGRFKVVGGATACTL